MSSKFVLSAVGVVLFAAACGQVPTAPSVSPSGALPGLLRSDADVSSPLEMRALAGRVTNALTGGAAPGITLDVAGVGVFAANTAGQFNVESEAPDATYRVTASGAGVVARQTTLTFPGSAPVISLIPSTFNMTAFDQMMRQFGPPLGVVKRWTQAPGLVIETSLVDAASVVGGVPTLNGPIASSEQLSEASINELIAALTRALPLLTAGHLPAFTTIDRFTTPAGSVIEMDRPGVITVARYPGRDQLCQGYTIFLYNDVTFEATSGRLYIQTCSQLAGAAPLATVIAHELGHALGYAHVTATPSVMAPTIFDDVTLFDRQAAAIVFQRFPEIGRAHV